MLRKSQKIRSFVYSATVLFVVCITIMWLPQYVQAAAADQYVCPKGYELRPGSYEITTWCEKVDKTVTSRTFVSPIDKSAHKCPKGQSVGAEVGANTNTSTAICVDSSGTKAGSAQGLLTCSGFTQYFNSPIKCIGRTISVYVGTAAITTAAWLLAIASYLFNVLVDHTVVRFGEVLLNVGVRQAIEVGWTALRDVANIVIIAMFVFIAVNIILGVKEFGEKRLIARVLIIAVLINFSLLFTKAIIDASNFTAYQFVKASGFESNNRDTQRLAPGPSNDTFVTKGIAGEFIKFMGLASVGETHKALSKTAFGSEDKLYENADGWYALLHGLVSATLLLIAAAVLLYACYFLVTRAVLLIFLMMTSALAFASWLIPQQRIVKGFARWWESLLKAALFGPLLVMFLWASLNVARAIAANPEVEKGTLGGMISDPTQTLNLEALFSYVVVIGLLFASIYAANILSQGIAGFAAAGNLVKGVGFAGPAIAWRFTGAPLLRQTVGRFGYWQQGVYADTAKEARTKAGQLRQEASLLRTLKGDEAGAKAKEKEAARFDRKAAKAAMTSSNLTALSGAGFNLGSSSSFKTLGKMMGTPLLGSADRSRDAAGFAQAIEQKIKRGDDLAQKFAVSAGEKDKIRAEATKNVLRERATGQKERIKEVNDAEGEYQTRAKKQIDDRDAARKKLTELAGENIRIEDARIHSNTRIKDAARDLDTAQATLDAIDRTRLNAAEKELREFYNKVTESAEVAATKTIEAAERGAAEAARAVGKKVAGFETPAMRTYIGNEVRGKFKGGVATKSMRDALALAMKDLEAGKPSPLAPAPPPPPPTGAPPIP